MSAKCHHRTKCIAASNDERDGEAKHPCGLHESIPLEAQMEVRTEKCI